MAVIRQARTHPDKHPWLLQLLARRPAKVAAVALANKMWPIEVRLLGSIERATSVSANNV
jgi:transposase